MPDEKEVFEEVEDIVNESDEGVESLVDSEDPSLTADTEQYDESDDEAADEGPDDDEPEELDFEPAESEEDEDAA